VIARITGVLLAAIVLFGLLLFGVLSSTAGNRFVVRMVEEQLAPALSVDGLSGSLLGELCADEVVYQGSAVSVQVREVCVEPELWTSIDFLMVNLASVRAAAVRIETTATQSDEGDVPGLPLSVSVSELSLGRLDVNGVLIDDIEASLALTDEDFAVTGELSYEQVEVALQTGGPLSAFWIDVQALNARADIELNLLAESLPWQLDLNVSELNLGRFIDRPVRLQGARLEAVGDLSGYEYRIAGRVEDEEVSGDLQAEGAGAWQGINFQTLNLADAQLARQPIRVDVLSAVGSISWQDGFDARFDRIEARGSAAEQALDAKVQRLLLSDRHISVESGRLALADGGRLDVDGRFDFTGVVQAQVEGAGLALSLLRPDLGGQADLKAMLEGPFERPSVEGTATVSGLIVGERLLGDLMIELSGTPDRGRVELNLDAGMGRLEALLAYTITEEEIAVAVEEALAGYPTLEATARLEQPAYLLIDGDSIRVDDACLLLQSRQLEAAPGRLCGTLNYPKGGLSMKLDAWDMPDLPLPESSASVTGSVAVQVAVDEFSPVRGEAGFAFSDLVASHPDLDPLVLGDVRMDVVLEEDLATATLATPEDESQELSLTGRLTSELAPMLEASTLDGELRMALNGIWVAEGLLPMDVTYELDDIRGVMEVTARVRGTVGKPVIDGDLSLEDAGWQVLAVNASVHDLDLNATLTESRDIRFTSAAMVGEGGVSLQGSLNGLDTDLPRLRAQVAMTGAQLVDLPDYRAAVDGEIALDMGPRDLRVEGEVRLPRASILIADLPESAVTVSGDEIVVDEAQTAAVQQVRTTDVTLSLGDEVFLEAFGLRGRLTGSLRLRESPGRLRSVTGVINLREAEFEAYGQTLTVERGQLTFTGPVDNPAVDVAATRIVTYEERDYRVSLLISGTARNLETEVVSQPSLPEGDALALLITGQTFSQISSDERSNVSGAAISMGLLSATGVTQNVASALNLEEIIVDEDAEGNMEVGAAVRLNRQLYLRYTYGVFSRLGGVLLRYRFSSRFSVQAKTGDSHSIEIRYGVDD